MSFTNYLEQKVLEHVFRNVTYTPPTTIYVTFFTVAPTDTTAGTEMTGGLWGGRQACAFSAWVAADGVKNSAVLNFVTNAGTVVAIGLMDASSGGNLLAYKTFTGVTYINGEAVQIPIAGLAEQLD